MTRFLLPRPRPRPPCCCCSVLLSLALFQARAGSGMQPTIVLSDSPSIQFMRQDEGRGRRGGSGFSFFFCVLSPFFLSFFLSESSSERERDRQTDRQTESLNSLRLASPQSWNSPACLKPPLFRASAFFRFFVSPLFFFALSPSIYLSNNPEQANKFSIITTSNGHPTLQNRTLPPLANSARMPSG